MGARILVIDDHAVVRRGFQDILADSLPSARFGDAQDAQQALDQIRAGRWDIAVLDLNLPGRGGLDLLRSLKEEQPDLRVLVYTIHSEEHFGLRAIRAGADGYLSKDQSPNEIPRAILQILKGGQYVSTELAQTLVTSVRGESRANYDLLSDREIQVLRLLALGKGPSEIGRELSLSAKTVSTYRARVLEKLKLRTNAELVRYAIEYGMID